MPRGVKKENLPVKICVTCNRPFNWRKKWEKCWDEVTTCSKGCNEKRRDKNREMNIARRDNSGNDLHIEEGKASGKKVKCVKNVDDPSKESQTRDCRENYAGANVDTVNVSKHNNKPEHVKSDVAKKKNRRKKGQRGLCSESSEED